RCIQPKQMHDITGHYNRFDIFQLRVDRTARMPVEEFGEAASAASESKDDAKEGGPV
ncbi:MAG: carbon-nitrogen hydrolase family protein, partial [Alphaproteobacteria bacterium]|nr:carbon-nitrogen hydrolase family protein [Alphaproteobacteria bacterium]